MLTRCALMSPYRLLVVLLLNLVGHTVAQSCTPLTKDPYVPPSPGSAGSFANPTGPRYATGRIRNAAGEVAVLRTQAPLSELPKSWQRSGCPHLQSGLKFWSQPSTWSNNQVPKSGQDVWLPNNSKVNAGLSYWSRCMYSACLRPLSDLGSCFRRLFAMPYCSADVSVTFSYRSCCSFTQPDPMILRWIGLVLQILLRGCDLPAGTRFKRINVPTSSELIIDDADMTLECESITVSGRLRVGAPECRLFATITFKLHGSKDAFGTHKTLNKEMEMSTKGIVADNGGQLDIHGKRFHPTWTRLANSVSQGSNIVQLQDQVNWEVGQYVLLVTSFYLDEYRSGSRPDANEVHKIVAVSEDGRSIKLENGVKYQHYGGPEYQVEVALLSRRITIQGVGNGGEFGGHTAIRHNGSGRFSGVLGYEMGQKNQMGTISTYQKCMHYRAIIPDPNWEWRTAVCMCRALTHDDVTD
eukprot:scaffold2973_cov325-Prasinococcus_capsulatus_cf.AAC.3